MESGPKGLKLVFRSRHEKIQMMTEVLPKKGNGQKAVKK